MAQAAEAPTRHQLGKPCAAIRRSGIWCSSIQCDDSTALRPVSDQPAARLAQESREPGEPTVCTTRLQYHPATPIGAHGAARHLPRDAHIGKPLAGDPAARFAVGNICVIVDLATKIVAALEVIEIEQEMLTASRPGPA